MSLHFLGLRLSYACRFLRNPWRFVQKFLRGLCRWRCFLLVSVSWKSYGSKPRSSFRNFAGFSSDFWCSLPCCALAGGSSDSPRINTSLVSPVLCFWRSRCCLARKSADRATGWCLAPCRCSHRSFRKSCSFCFFLLIWRIIKPCSLPRNIILASCACRRSALSRRFSASGGWRSSCLWLHAISGRHCCFSALPFL